jgi:hypothetical protein
MAGPDFALRAVFYLCVGLFGFKAAGQSGNANAPHTISGAYRIAGTVVSKADGHPLARARVTIRDTQDSQRFQSVITAEDGKYEFAGLPAGKYSLEGMKRGFILARYDQHEQFSTAIVTGAGLDTESLVLRLAPNAVIAGRVLNEFGEPVRHAAVMLYFQDHSEGVDRIRQSRSSQANDLGEYEMTPLRPGTYFLSASAQPWYAVHPHSEQKMLELSLSDSSQPPAEAPPTVEAPPTIDRSLDVSYPVTYYADVTDSDDAAPILIRGGEHLQLDIHLNPVPALRLVFRVPGDDKNGYKFPRLEQSTFDGSTFVQGSSVRQFPLGLVEIAGIPAGRYNIRLSGPGPDLQLNGVDLMKDGEEIDTSKSEALSTVKVTVQIQGEAALPRQLTIGLRAGSRMSAFARPVDKKGEAELESVPAGRYEFAIWGGGKPYFIAHISADGAEVSGHTLNVTAGSSPSVTLTLVAGSADVEGIVTRAGKGFAGAMVVLVPKDPEVNHDLFRRDQSDLDGTFLLRGVTAGSYTILAIENGWDLDWSQPNVIGAYAKRGRAIQVGNQTAPIKVAEPIEVQPR